MKIKKVFIFISALIVFAGAMAFSPVKRGTEISDKDNKVIQESSIYVEMNQNELFGYADIIANGKVKKINPPKEYKHNIGGEDKFIICKDYIFEVNESYKGTSPGSEIIIRVPGGEFDKKMYMSDAEMPDLKREQVLFLKRYQGDNSNDVTYSILGGPQGKYVIEDNKAINIEKEKDANQFKEELNSLSKKMGDKIVLPPGFIN